MPAGAVVHEPVARLRGVTVSHGDTRALDGVTVNIGTGLTALLGQNGAGKTTLMRVLIGDAGCDAGDVDLRADVAASIGAVPQEAGIPGLMRVSDVVEYAAWLHRVDASVRRARVDAVLARVGLGDSARARTRALSGGMRRRVALATALVHDPSLLVLDEPTAGLDPVERERFNSAVAAVVADGTAVLLSTHILEDVEDRADHVVALAGGRVAVDASYEAFTEGRSLRDAYARTIAAAL